MTSSAPVGVFAQEVQSIAAPAIQGLPTNTSAFVGRAPRGWVNKAIKVNDLGKFKRVFGNPDPNSYLYQSVNGFFSTMGAAQGNGSATGADLYIVRPLGTGGGGSNVKASLTLGAPNGAATSGSITGTNFPLSLALTPGTTFVAKIDGGSPVTATVEATQATYTGSAYAVGAVTAGHFLEVIVGGVSRFAFCTVGTEINSEAKALAFLNAIPGIHVTDSGTVFEIFTDQFGSGASGSISASSSTDVLTALGFTGGASFTNAGPNNVANLNLPGGGISAAEFAAMATAAFTGSVTTSTPTTVTTTSSTTGLSSTVQYTNAGTGTSFITGFDNGIHAGTAAGGATPVATFTAVGEGTEDNFSYIHTTLVTNWIGSLSAGVAAGSGVTTFPLTPATAGRIKVGDTVSIIDSNTNVTVRGYAASIQNNSVIVQTGVTVASGGLTTGTSRVYLETFSLSFFYQGVLLRTVNNLRMSPKSLQNYFVTVINNNDDEQQIVATDLNVSPSNTLDNRPVNINATGDYLTGGQEETVFLDSDYIGSSTQPKTGLYALDQVKAVRRVAVPGITGTTTGAVAQAVLIYCENRTDCRAVLGVPPGFTASQAVTYRTNVLGNSSYGAMYVPWIYVFDPTQNQTVLFPPEAWVMGMNARCSANRGVAKAPAGTRDGNIPSATDVETRFDDDDFQFLTQNNINTIRPQGVDGICVMLARTLQQGGNEGQIHIRDTLIYIETSLKAGSKWVYEEPNTAATRSANATACNNFLEAEWTKGTLDGAKDSDAFAVKCDATNNPPNVVNAATMITDVWVKIPNCVERALINITNATGQVTS